MNKMFQPSHFQKMAKHLGTDSLLYEKEYNGFMAKLKNFHESKGTPFRRLPWLGGQYLDLYLLYRKVTSSGGWLKVTEDKKWRDIAEVFNLPPTCTNAAFALRQHYSRYLESFERINFFGEDAEDVLAAGRPHTPVGGGIIPTHLTTDYISVISINKDATRNFDKLVLSLQCGMPNEVDFAINICMLLSNVSNSVFNLSKAPAVVDTLLAHVGVFSEDSHSLRELYDEWYVKQGVKRDFIKFWKESVTVKGIYEILCGNEGDETGKEEPLFHPPRQCIGARDVEYQRVVQVCMILYNFSFDSTNANVLASHPLCLRFLVLCICGNRGFLQRMAWGTLSNLAERMVMEPIESTTTQMFFQMLHIFFSHKDRYQVINAMDILGKLCTLEGNDDVIEAGLEPEAYEALIKVLIISDVQIKSLSYNYMQLVISSLESLYNLSGVGQVTSDHIAEVHHSIDVLVCLATMDAESFGSEALSEVQIIENRAVAAMSVASKPQPTPTPVVPQQPKEPVQPLPVSHSSPAPSAAMAQVPAASTTSTPTPTPVKTTGSEIDPETFTFNWLQGTYEACPGSSVSRIDIYADYLSSCSRLARVGILNATAFNRIIKLAFPDGQLRRAQSGSQVQYVLAGLKRKANPLPVKSRTDAPPVHQSTGAGTPHLPPAQQLGQKALSTPPPVQQGVSRTPTPPAPPVWNAPKQQTSAVPSPQSLTTTAATRPFNQRSVQGPGAVQVVGTPQQSPGVVPLPRRTMPSYRGNQPTTEQVVRPSPEGAMQQMTPQLPLVGHRQATNVPIQGAVSPLVKGPSLERPPSHRAISGGTNLSHSQGQHMPQLQRMPVPVQSAGPLRQLPLQKSVHQVPSSASHGAGPFPPQLAAKSSHPPVLNLGGNVHSTQSSLASSPLPPHSPMQLPSPRPTSAPPPMALVQRPPSAVVSSSYRPAPPYQQPSALHQQQMRQSSPGLNPRPSYGSYPPLAPKPPQGISIAGFPQRGQLGHQVPSNPGAVARYPSFPQGARLHLQQPSAVRPNFQHHGPPLNTPQSPLQAPASVGGQRLVNPQKELAQDLRPSQGLNIRPASAPRQKGVVLIAQEERAADVVSRDLLGGAEEQTIIVVENKSRTEMECKAQVTKNLISNQGPCTQPQVATDSMIYSQACDAQSKICESMCAGEPGSSSLPASNGGIKRNFDIHTSETSRISATSENSQTDRDRDNSEHCVALKRPRLDSRVPSLENDLESSSSLPCRTGSPTTLVNGDIKGDPRNKLMDKLLDKDLHIPLNGVCNIDPSELDLMASDGERLSSSKASSPDLFDSETNSDFGKYLEESDTDTGLFSDVLQGDLRIDPMENGTKGQDSEEHKSVLKSPPVPSLHGVPFDENPNASHEKGTTAATAVQGRVPISPVIAAETKLLHGGALTSHNSVLVNKYPTPAQPPGQDTLNLAWKSGDTISLGSKHVYPQSYANQVHPKIAPHPPNLYNKTQSPQNSTLENPRRDNRSSLALRTQQTSFPIQNVSPDSQQIVTTHPSGVLQNISPTTHHTSVANSSMVAGVQGLNTACPSITSPPPFRGSRQMQLAQTSSPVVQPVGVPENMSFVRGAESSDGSRSVSIQGQYGGPGRTEVGMQKANSSGMGPQSANGVQYHQSRPPQQPPNLYPDIRTRSIVTPDASTFEGTAVSQSRQPAAAVLSHCPQPSSSPAKGMVPAPIEPMPSGGTRSEDVRSTHPSLGNPADAATGQVDSPSGLYKCRWATCFSSFDTSKGLFSHVVNEHVPRDSLMMSCLWEGCAPVRRSRSSLLFHLQQKHSEPSPVPSAPPPPPPVQNQSSSAQHPPQPQAPQANQPTSFVPAYQFLARMLQSLQGEEESPLTKTIRLTAALVLRNIAQYSALARSMLRRHERHLSLVAMSNSEAANAVAACLSELSPHRRASSDDSDTFIWAVDR